MKIPPDADEFLEEAVGLQPNRIIGTATVWLACVVCVVLASDEKQYKDTGEKY